MKQKLIKSSVIPKRLYFDLYLSRGLKYLNNIWQPTLIIWLSVISVIFLLANIAASQNISALFLGVTSYDKNSVVSYLKMIRHLPVFEKELTTNMSIYGNDTKNDVFSIEIFRSRAIQNYEQLLYKNPSSRDLLYGLYLLYSRSGDSIKANNYLLRAKAIDPGLKN